MILDRFGREIKSGKPIIEEIAVQTVRDRYSSYPSSGLTPERLARIFKEADQGDVARQAELFEEMEEKDLHLGGVLETRRLAVAGLEWEIEAASDSSEDKKIAEAAREMIKYLENWEEALLDLLDAVGKGFSVLEIIWEIADRQVWAKSLDWVHQKRFTFNSPDKILKFPRLLTDEAPVWGEDLPEGKFVYHRSKTRSGIAPRGGLLRPCSYMYLFKNYTIKDWVIFNELFSVPMRVGKYKPGSTPEEIDTLKRAVFNLGVDAAAVVSDSTIIELVESARKGDVGAFENLGAFCDRAMSKGVLGHTGSAEGTPGKLGSEDQAKEVRQDLLEADAKSVMKTITFKLFKPWAVYNFGADKGVPGFKLHFEAPDDLKTTAEVYGILVKDVNFQGIPEDHVYERFGIPRPTAGQKTITPAASANPLAVPPVSPKETSVSANKQRLLLIKNTAPGDDWVTTYMERLSPFVSKARFAALDEIEQWLRSLSGPPTEVQFTAKLQELLGAAYGALNVKAIADTVSDIYLAYRQAPGVWMDFGGPDIRSINFLSQLDNFYVSKFITNSDAQKVVADFLKERYLEQGAGLFGRGTPADTQAFRDLFSQKLTEIEDWQIRRIVDTSVARAQNWAAVSQFNSAAIPEIQIYEPTQECGFCGSMNGRVISVPVAYETMMAQAAMTPEQYQAEFANSGYLPVEANIDTIVGAGLLPPYHPHCRGIVIKRMA